MTDDTFRWLALAGIALVVGALYQLMRQVGKIHDLLYDHYHPEDDDDDAPSEGLRR